MNVQNQNTVYLTNKEFESEFDVALIEDSYGREFLFNCASTDEKDTYSACLAEARKYKDAYYFVPDSILWETEFFAVEPKYKRGILSDMLEYLTVEPDLMHPFTLYHAFGGHVYATN